MPLNTKAFSAMLSGMAEKKKKKKRGPRTSMNIEISEGKRQLLAFYCESHGLIQRHVMGRLVDFFILSSDEIKRVMLADINSKEGILVEAYAKMLEMAASELRARYELREET